MKWCARHPFLLWLVLVAVDVALVRHFGMKAEASKEPEMQGWATMSMMAIIFGTLCIRFPHILGTMEGPAVSSNYLIPTPHGVVKGAGWAMMLAPPLLFLFLAVFGGGK